VESRKAGNLVTRSYQAGGRLDGQHAIDYLWSKVDALEDADWPVGVWPTPRTHNIGTAGFPDGAGLVWRTGDPMPQFPVGGMLLVGHYTDSKKNHGERRGTGMPSPGEPPEGVKRMWRRFYKMVDHAGIDPREVFFTNTYVGLCDDPKASGHEFPGRRNPSFAAWCSAFVDEQIQLMRPRVVIALGKPARLGFGWRADGLIGTAERADVAFKAAAVYDPSTPGHLHQRRSDTGELGWDWQVRTLKEVMAQ
jgi:hypothetical protein